MCERVGSSTDVILRNSSRLLALTVFRQQLRQECLFACRGEFTQPYARDTWRCFSLHPLFTLPFRARRTRGLRHKRHGIHVICRASAIIFPLKLRWLLFKDASPVERITLKCDIEDTLHFTRCRWHSKKHYFKKRLWRINNHIFSYSEGLNSLWKGFFFFFFLFPWKCASARLLGNNGVVDGSPLLCAPLPVFILAVFLKVLKPGAYPKHSFESLNLSLFFGPLPSFSLSRRSSPLLIRRELFFFLPLRRRKTNKKKKTLFSIWKKQINLT